MPWSTVHFGKHRGKTLPQILCSDPDWFFWAIDENVFDNKGVLSNEAEDLLQKATHIRIPNDTAGELEAEYYIHPPTRKFSHFDVVPASRPVHNGSSPTFRLRVIDMSVPRQIEDYDKQGYKNFMSSLKFHLFGSESVRLIKKLCEDFFSDANNFV